MAYGFWRYTEADLAPGRDMLERIRTAGIDHLDTADIYGGRDNYGSSERLLGALRSSAPSLFDGAEIATKAGVEFGSPYNSSRAYIRAACEGSLTRLGVERIDLYYIHRPDILTHPADLAETLDGLVDEGKIASIGASNFTIAQLDALARHLRHPIRAHQIEVSAAHAAPILDGTIDHAMRERTEVVAWSPLAGGRLLGEAADLAAVRLALVRVAHAHGVGVEAAALAFLMRHPAGIVPILGTTTPERLEACLAARKVTLTRSEWYAILEARLGAPMP